jgi:hypothetical protein
MQPVPQVQAAELLQWLYQNSPQIRINGPAYQVLLLPELPVLDELLAAAQERGCEWVLLDGPRQQRPNWMMDPWWSDQPEMPGRLIELTQSRCVQITSLRQAINPTGMM